MLRDTLIIILMKNFNNIFLEFINFLTDLLIAEKIYLIYWKITETYVKVFYKYNGNTSKEKCDIGKLQSFYQRGCLVTAEFSGE